MKENAARFHWVFLTSMLVTMVVLAGGAWFYSLEQQQSRQGVESELEAIVQMKVDQIAAWRAERLADAEVLSNSVSLNEEIAPWIKTHDPALEEKILRRLDVTAKAYHYHRIILAGTGSQMLMSSTDRLGRISEEEAQSMASALRFQKPVMTDLYLDPDTSSPRISIVAPVPTSPGTALILECDPSQSLYRMIQSWPAPRRSAETNLVRRDGDAVLFLNELRHQKNTALKLRIPLTRVDVPSVMAVLGKKGVVVGPDYRGVETLANLRAVPDSPWYVIAKMDTQEVFATCHKHSAFILALILLVVAMIFVSTGYIWQRIRKETMLQQTAAELAKTHLRLQQSLRFTEALLSALPTPAFYKDREGRYLGCNRAFSEMTGVTSEEMKGKTVYDLWPGEHAGIYHQKDLELMSKPCRQVYEYKMRDKDGVERPVIFVKDVFRDENDQVAGIVGAFLDITEQKRDAELLRQSEKRYRELMVNLDAGVVVHAPDTSVIMSNSRASELLGLSEMQMKDRLAIDPHWEFLHEDHTPLSLKEYPVNKVIAEKKAIKDLCLGIMRPGSHDVVWVSVNGVPIFDQRGAIREIIISFVDITEQKQAENEIRQLNAELEQRVQHRTTQLAQANQELEAFSYSVSHDLRAPLRAVDGFSRMVVEDYAGRLDDEGRRMLGVIRSETQRMGRLIDDLLAFSRLGRQQLEPESIDMRELAQEVYAELAAQEPPGRKLKLDLQPLPAVQGTRTMIRQLWVNLIGNAIKFTKRCEVGEIEIAAQPGEDGVPVFRIKDNGAGFDMRFADKLFGVFQRLHSAEEFAGTGVGLALVQRIVHRHGGRIWAVGEVDHGATFFFTLPNPAS